MIGRVRLVAAQLVLVATLCGIAAGQPAERVARVGLIVTTPALTEAFVRPSCVRPKTATALGLTIPPSAPWRADG